MKRARRSLLPLLILALALTLGVTALAAEAEPAGTGEKTVESAAANVVASGDCGAEGDNVKWTLTDDGTLTISGTGKMADWGYLDHAPWYYKRESIKEVVIQNGVTSIGYGAFGLCIYVPSVTIPDSVTYIDSSAFDGCFALSEIQVASGNKNYCSIDGVVFSKDKTTLVIYTSGKKENDYTIPDGVTRIGDGAFSNSYLDNIIIPTSVTSIGDGAFSGLSSLDSITIPASVTSIGNCVFTGCINMTAIYVESGNKNYCAVDGVLFNKAKTKLLRYPSRKNGASYNIPSGVTSIEEDAFANCHDLTSVTIPDSVNSIGESAFYFCENLTSVSIPDGVKRIEDSTFFDCYSLQSVSIPNSVTSIGEWAFESCDLTSVIIPDSVTSIGTGAFNCCDNMTSVKISSNVTKIEYSTFNYCKSLTSIVIPNSVVEIDQAFEHCSSLTNVTIPASVNNISALAFYDCPENLAITGAKGSYVETYAKERGITFKAVSNSSVMLPAPTGVKVSSEATGVKVSWTKVTGAAKYRVFYKPTGGSWAKAGDTTSTSYTWTKAKSGTTYQIRVRCITADGKYGTSDFSTALSITYKKPSTYKYAAPTGLTISNEATGIKATWNKVSGAAKYRVFYKPSGGSWAKAGDTTSTSYTWTGAKSGTTYQIRVRCITSDGKTGTSDFSTALSITYKKPSTYKYAAPTNVKVSSEKTGVKVTWTKVSGAAKYRVFYKPSGGSWTKAGDTTATSYTWTGAKSGTTYQIRVRCITSDGKTGTSDFSASKTITYKKTSGYSLFAPKGLKVENHPDGIHVSWNPQGGPKFRVFYKPEGGSWTKAGDTDGFSYTWKGAKSGTTYQIRVRVISSDGKEGLSNFCEARTITYVAAPQYTVDRTITGKIKISWDKVPGAAKYRVYYKTSGGWKTLTTTPNTSCTIDKPKDKTTYTFRVRCVDGNGVVSSSYNADTSYYYTR